METNKKDKDPLDEIFVDKHPERSIGEIIIDKIRRKIENPKFVSKIEIARLAIKELLIEQTKRKYKVNEVKKEKAIRELEKKLKRQNKEIKGWKDRSLLFEKRWLKVMENLGIDFRELQNLSRERPIILSEREKEKVREAIKNIPDEKYENPEERLRKTEGISPPKAKAMGIRNARFI